MNNRQFNKHLKRSLYHKGELKGKRYYTYRGVNESGVYICLGFTSKPKQKSCVCYHYAYITDTRYYAKSRANAMFDVFKGRV
jgi:hypothetical protein